MAMVKFVVGLVPDLRVLFVISFTFGLFPQTAGISTTLLDYLGHTFGRVGGRFRLPAQRRLRDHRRRC